jgi:hypothetical protein
MIQSVLLSEFSIILNFQALSPVGYRTKMIISYTFISANSPEQPVHGLLPAPESIPTSPMFPGFALVLQGFPGVFPGRPMFMPGNTPIISPFPFMPARPPPAPHLVPPRQHALGRRPVAHRVFTSNHDDHFALIMARHRIGEDFLNWEVITTEFGGDFTPRQLMHGWFLYLCPELTAANFAADERRTMVKLGINEYGNWAFMSQRMGNDPI